MKERLRVPITGMIDSKKSFLQADLDTVYIGKNRYLNILVSFEIYSEDGKASFSTIETFETKIYIDDKLLKRETIEIDLLNNHSGQFETDLELHNSQYETRLLKVELCNFKNNLIDYTAIKEMINIEPIKESKTYIKLNYYRDSIDLSHNFSYYTNKSTNRIFMKMNNNNWKEIKNGFSLKNDELEGKINYIQLYTTDDENNKIYSNVIRFIKSESPE